MTVAVRVGLRQRPPEKKAKRNEFAANPSFLSSRCTSRPPPNRGTFRLRRWGSVQRQTPCWRKRDSNLWSHLQRGQPFRAPHSVSASAASAANVLISENGDLSSRQPRQPRSLSHVRRAEWLASRGLRRRRHWVADRRRRDPLEIDRGRPADGGARESPRHRSSGPGNINGQGGRGGPE